MSTEKNQVRVLAVIHLVVFAVLWIIIGVVFGRGRNREPNYEYRHHSNGKRYRKYYNRY